MRYGNVHVFAPKWLKQKAKHDKLASPMRRLWIIFSQTATICLAVLFVVSTLKPEWLPGARRAAAGRRRAAGGAGRGRGAGRAPIRTTRR